MTATAHRPRAGREQPEAGSAQDAGPWRGPTRPYDLVKEVVAATVAVTLLVFALAALLGCPDEKAITLQSWSRAASSDFLATTVSELDGTSSSAGYGPPYNHAAQGQQLGPLPLARWIGGYRIPIDTADDFVIGPLARSTPTPNVETALAQWQGADADQQQRWAGSYGTALSQAPDGEPGAVPPGDYGPVPQLGQAELTLAQSGGLDGALTFGTGFYPTDQTRPLLFLADSTYLADTGQAQHLAGNQWGMMNETGNYPGQAWLWLYTFWYQVSPFNSSGNADAMVWTLMGVLTLAFVFVPFLPGIRELPRRLGVHRLIWRTWYARSH